MTFELRKIAAEHDAVRKGAPAAKHENLGGTKLRYSVGRLQLRREEERDVYEDATDEQRLKLENVLRE